MMTGEHLGDIRIRRNIQGCTEPCDMTLVRHADGGGRKAVMICPGCGDLIGLPHRITIIDGMVTAYAVIQPDGSKPGDSVNHGCGPRGHYHIRDGRVVQA